jgi:hypothetical protein
MLMASRKEQCDASQRPSSRSSTVLTNQPDPPASPRDEGVRRRVSNARLRAIRRIRVLGIFTMVSSLLYSFGNAIIIRETVIFITFGSAYL